MAGGGILDQLAQIIAQGVNQPAQPPLQIDPAAAGFLAKGPAAPAASMAQRLQPNIQQHRQALMGSPEDLAAYAAKQNLSHDEIKYLINDNYSSPKFRAATFDAYLKAREGIQ